MLFNYYYNWYAFPPLAKTSISGKAISTARDHDIYQGRGDLQGNLGFLLLIKETICDPQPHLLFSSKTKKNKYESSYQ